MKRFFEEHTSAVIICIVVSLLLCIVGSVKGINSSKTSVEGSGLLKNVVDNLTDTIDTYQKQAVPNENIMTTQNVKTNFVDEEYRGYDVLKFVKLYEGTNQKLSFQLMWNYQNQGNCFYTLGHYYINRYRRKLYNINNAEWYRVKIEGTTVGYNPNELNGERCMLSFYCTYGTGITPAVKNIKIELGDKATPHIE